MIDPEWDEILSRDMSIREKDFDQICALMQQSYLDRNPLIIQRLTALRITKAKEESVSDCMRRILDSYTSAQLGEAPLPTLALLHLMTMLPGDNLSEKIKAHLIEKMRLTPNIKSLEELLAYILSQEGDNMPRKNTQDKIRRVNRAMEKEEESKEPSVPKRKHECRICDKEHER